MRKLKYCASPCGIRDWNSKIASSAWSYRARIDPKLHRTFESIEAGHVDQALVDLSGGIGSRIDMSKDPFKQQTRNGVLFKQLLAYKQAGFLLGAGSPAGSDSEANASASGIVQGHAYAILSVEEVDDVQLLRLRNPWGRKEWTGDWSDKSPLGRGSSMESINVILMIQMDYESTRKSLNTQP